jgi:hypothetical protein
MIYAPFMRGYAPVMRWVRGEEPRIREGLEGARKNWPRMNADDTDRGGRSHEGRKNQEPTGSYASATKKVLARSAWLQVIVRKWFVTMGCGAQQTIIHDLCALYALFMRGFVKSKVQGPKS